MDRHDLDEARLAAALIVADGGRHQAVDRRAAYERARGLYSALEDAEVTETSLAMAMHGAWCSGSRSASFHGWSNHRPEAGEILQALSDPALEARLEARALKEDPERP